MVDLVLRPRDGLTVKDARGFSLAGGITAGGLPWPGPATTAGATRAMVGRLAGFDERYGEDTEQWMGLLDSVQVTGPIVVARPIGGTRWSPLWPAPTDHLRLPHPRAGERGQPEARLLWLRPEPRQSAAFRALGHWDGGVEAEAIEALWLPRLVDPDKPLEPRALWSHDQMVAWLRGPRDRDEPGEPPLEPAERLDIHVAIEGATEGDAAKGWGAARDEYLFAHPTYESVVQPPNCSDFYELALALRVEGADEGVDLTTMPWRVGGEGRFAAADQVDRTVLDTAARLAATWEPTARLRLVLVTPARFASGWRPDWLTPGQHAAGPRFEGTLPGLNRRVVLRAAFVDRPWWTSGWDVARRRPKPSEAAVAAGAVYYLESLAEPFTAEDITALWLHSIQQPNEQCARDGFGLVLPGAWPTSA